MPQKRSKSLKIARNRSKSLEIARNRSNLASADVTLQLRLGFWPVKSGQCSNVLPIVSVVGPNYQFQLLPTLNSMFLESLTRGARLVLSMGLAAGCVRARSSSSPLRGGHCPPSAASTAISKSCCDGAVRLPRACGVWDPLVQANSRQIDSRLDE